MGRHVVRGGLFQGAQHGGAAPEAVLHGLADGRGAEGFAGHVVDVLQGRFAVDPEDVDLVRVPQDVAIGRLRLRQSLRQAVGAVAADGRLQDAPRLCGQVQREPRQQALLKEQVRAQGRVVHGGGVHEGAPAPDLLKAADVVEHAAEPGQVGVRQAVRDLPAEGRDPVGVVDLELDLGVGGVVAGHVAVEGLHDAVFVHAHRSSRAFNAMPARRNRNRRTAPR